MQGTMVGLISDRRILVHLVKQDGGAQQMQTDAVWLMEK